jgi:hypothetical protein
MAAKSRIDWLEDEMYKLIERVSKLEKLLIHRSEAKTLLGEDLLEWQDPHNVQHYLANSPTFRLGTDDKSPMYQVVPKHLGSVWALYVNRLQIFQGSVSECKMIAEAMEKYRKFTLEE